MSCVSRAYRVVRHKEHSKHAMIRSRLDRSVELHATAFSKLATNETMVYTPVYIVI